MRRVLAIAGLAALIAGCGATTKVAQTAVPTTLAGAQGLQTNNPGWPGFGSQGWLLGGGVNLEARW